MRRAALAISAPGLRISRTPFDVQPDISKLLDPLTCEVCGDPAFDTSAPPLRDRLARRAEVSHRAVSL